MLHFQANFSGFFLQLALINSTSVTNSSPLDTQTLMHSLLHNCTEALESLYPSLGGRMGNEAVLCPLGEMPPFLPASCTHIMTAGLEKWGSNFVFTYSSLSVDAHDEWKPTQSGRQQKLHSKISSLLSPSSPSTHPTPQSLTHSHIPSHRGYTRFAAEVGYDNHSATAAQGSVIVKTHPLASCFSFLSRVPSSKSESSS